MTALLFLLDHARPLLALSLLTCAAGLALRWAVDLVEARIALHASGGIDDD